MTLKEVDVAIHKLAVLDTYRRLNDEDVAAEYTKYLMGVEFPVFNAVFERLKVTTGELPTIAALDMAIKDERPRGQEKRFECALCNGTGLVLMQEEHFNVKYDMHYACVCGNGKKYQLDFSKATDPLCRQPIRFRCISEVVDPSKLRSEKNERSMVK